MSSSNYEGSGYGHKLDLLIISYKLHVRHPSILVHKGVQKENVRLRPGYFTMLGKIESAHIAFKL